MQKFKCHKVVEAAKIIGVAANSAQPGALLHLSGEKVALALPPEWLQKHQPGSGIQSFTGGYLVVYDDGYTSYSPAAAFEAGYTAVVDESPEAAEQLCAQLMAEPIMEYFTWAHLPERLQAVSKPFLYMATHIMARPRSAERTVALRKLLECKDATVRAALKEGQITAHPPEVGRSTSIEPNMRRESER